MTLSLSSQAPNNDEIFFDLFGQFVWGDLNEPGLNNQLSELDVPSTEADTWRAFTTDYGKQVKSSQEKDQPTPALNKIPKIRDPQVKGWWETLAGAPSQDTWLQLLDGAHPSQASTDTPSTHIFGITGSAVDTARRSLTSDSLAKNLPPVPDPNTTAASSFGKASASGQKRAFVQSEVDQTRDENDTESQPPTKRPARPGSTDKAQKQASTTKKSVKGKGKSKDKAVVGSKQKNTSKAPPHRRSLRHTGGSRLERTNDLGSEPDNDSSDNSEEHDIATFSAAVQKSPQRTGRLSSSLAAKAVVSSASSSPGGARVTKPSSSVAAKAAVNAPSFSLETIHAADTPAALSASAQATGIAGLGSRGSKFVSCYRPGKVSIVKKHDKETGQWVDVPSQLWECRCCNKPVTVTGTNTSNMALHFNAKSATKAFYCKRKFNPADPEMQDVFLDKWEEEKHLHPHLQSAIDLASSTEGGQPMTSSSKPSSGAIQHSHDQRLAQHRSQTPETARRRAVLWLVAEGLPLTTLSQKTFIDFIESVNLATAQGLRSPPPKQMDQDLAILSGGLLNQGIKFLKSTAFSIQVDTRTSYSKEHSFLAISVSYIDDAWKLVTFCIDFQVVKGAHTGEEISERVEAFLSNNALWPTWTGVLTTDSDVYNSRVSPLLQKCLDEDGHQLKHVFHPAKAHVLCFVQQLELVRQTLCTAIGMPKEHNSKILGPISGYEGDRQGDGIPSDLAVGQWDSQGPQGDTGSTGEDRSEGTSRVPNDQVGLNKDAFSRDEEDQLLEGNSHAFDNGALLADLKAFRNDVQEPVGIPSSAQPYLNPLMKLSRIVDIACSTPRHQRNYVYMVKNTYISDPAKSSEVDVPPRHSIGKSHSRFLQLHTALRFAKGLVTLVKKDNTGDYGSELELKQAEIILLQATFDVLAYMLNLTGEARRADCAVADILRYHGKLAYILSVEIRKATDVGGEVGRFFATALGTAAEVLDGQRQQAASCDVLLLGSLLHPQHRLKTLRQGKDYPREAAMHAQDLLAQAVIQQRESDKAGIGKTRALSSKQEWERDEDDDVEEVSAVEQGGNDEIESYLTHQHALKAQQTVLQWWRENQASLPNLARVAKVVLASAATVSSMENVFSTANKVLSHTVDSKSTGQLVVSQSLIHAGLTQDETLL